MDNKRKSNQYLMAGMIALAAIAVLTVFVWNYYVSYISGTENETNEIGTEYTRHYVLIPDDCESVLWQDIYRSVSQSAQKNNAYLELMGNWEVGDYKPLDYLKLAIAANVDGIIIRPAGTAAMRIAIAEAEENEIPVIAILNDDSKSARKSFVGANNYQMGTTYGKEIIKRINDSTRKIMILVHSDMSGKELVLREVKNVVMGSLTPQQKEKIQILDKTIISGNAFDAEEAIRDLLHNEEQRPDILVCLNETDSESAYHTMIDYNLVGSIDIIGYYQTGNLMDAISKKTMPAVVSINTEQLGDACIQALEEYNNSGYTSSFYSVGLEVIDQSNVKHYMQ